MEKQIKVSIIIGNYNGEEYLETCLQSVLSSSYINFEVLILDDGSTDGSLEIIKKFKRKNKRIRFFVNKKNVGAAGVRNKAIKMVNGDIIIFLDNDTEIQKNTLSELIKPIVAHEEIGASQALILDFEKRDIIQMAGGLLIPQVAWLMPFYQGERLSQIKPKIKRMNIVAISAALAVKREVLAKVGGFDEKEAVHTEDLDFTWRIWLAGYKVILAPKSLVYHYTKTIKDRSSMMMNSRKIYFHLAKNSFRSILKNYELVNVLRFLSSSIFINLGRGILVFVRRGDVNALVATFQAIWWNISNLQDTLINRQQVQKTRVFSDEYILKNTFEKRGFIELYNSYFRKSKLLW